MRKKSIIYSSWEVVKNNRFLQILCTIIFVGFLLRLWGFWNIEGGDEYNEVFEALRIASGNFNTERWIKKTFKNILAIEYGIYFMIGWIFNMFSSLSDFARHIVRDFTPLLYIGRITSAIFGTFSIILLYQIGKKTYSREVGLIAAVLLAFNYICVYQSHLCLTDIPLLFFVLLSLFYIVVILEEGKLKHYALAAFFAAFAINTKIYGIVIGIPFLLAHFIQWKQQKNRTLITLFASKNIFLATGMFLIGMLLSNPEIVIGLPKYLHSFIWRAGIYTTSYQHVPPRTINGYVFYLKAMIGEMGLPIFIMACMALAYGIIKHRKQDILLISFCLVLTAILTHSKYLRSIRYMIPLFPFLFLMMGRFLADIIHKLMIGVRSKNLIMVACVLLLILHPAINIYRLELSLSRGNTNKMAKKWILEHIPSGSKLLVDMGRTFDDTYLRLPRSRKNLLDLLGKTKNLRDGEVLWGNVQTQIVDSYSSIFFKHMLETLPSITYDITSTGLARLVKPISYYREQNYDYVILRSTVVYRTRRQTWKKAYPTSWHFYRDIHKEFKLIKYFTPDRYTFGPTIKIYKVI